MQNDPAPDQDPVPAPLKERQRKRGIETEAQRDAEEQRPSAKPRPAQRQNKRTAGTTSGSVEQAASKRKDLCLTAAGSQPVRVTLQSLAPQAQAMSAVQSAQMQKQSQRMYRLLQELTKLKDQTWVVGDAEAELKGIISQTNDLRNFHAKQKVLRKQSIRALYTPICGALHTIHDAAQDYTHWIRTCRSRLAMPSKRR